MIEKWKSIKDFEGIYEVSNQGRIKRVSSGNIRTGFKDKNGYYRIVLTSNKKLYTKTIHRLVAEAWVLNLENKGDVNHIDGNKSNNNSNNLEWCTRKENVHHAIRLGLKNDTGENHVSASLTNQQVREIRALKGKMLQREIADLFGVHKRTVGFILTNKTYKNIE